MLLALLSLLVFLSVFVLFPLYILYRFIIKKDKITEEDLKRIIFPGSFAWIAAGMLLAYNVFYHDILMAPHYIPGIGIGLFTLAGLASLVPSIPKERRSSPVYGLLVLGSSAALAIAFQGNGFVHSVNASVVIFSLFGLLLIKILPKGEWNSFWAIRALYQIIRQGVDHLLNLVALTFQFKKKRINKGLAVLKTIVFASIVIFAFTFLLSAADPVFNELIKEFREEALERVIISLVITAALVLALSFPIKTEKLSGKPFHILSFNDLTYTSGGLVLLFAIFIGVQARYLFAAGADFSSFGLTYSEYVRKGFSELLLTTFGALLISYLLILKSKTETGKRMWTLKIINLALLIELLAILFSALQRNILYIETYGLTRIRIAGMVFLAWLGLLLLGIAILNLYKKNKEKPAMIGVFCLSLIAVIVLNLMNMDSIIARSSKQSEGQTDHFYIANLSTDAIYAWETSVLEASNFFDELLKKGSITSKDDRHTLVEYKLALSILEERRLEIHEKESKPVFAWNLSLARAETKMKEPVFSSKLPCLMEEMDDYQLWHLLDFEDLELRRLFSYEYPLTSRHIGREYYAYPRQLGQLMQDAIEEDDILRQQANELGFSKWLSAYDARVIARENIEFFEALRSANAPTSCSEII